MGWASYLEDIVDKLNSDLNQVRRDTSEGLDRSAQVRALIRVCERFLAGINEHLELATDPELDLANELIKLREANASLERRLGILEDADSRLQDLAAKHSELQQRFDEANGKAAKRYAEVKEWEKKYERLEKEYARAGKNRRR